MTESEAKMVKQILINSKHDLTTLFTVAALSQIVDETLKPEEEETRGKEVSSEEDHTEVRYEGESDG
jgi:hypothetical protein